MMRKDVLRKEHHLTVGINDLARLRHDAEAVAVAVEGEAELDAVLENRLLEVLEIGGLGGIGMMVREGAVNVREEFGHLAAKGLEEPGGDGPATPLPASIAMRIERSRRTSERTRSR